MKLGYKHTTLACYLGMISQAIVNNLAPLLFIIFKDEFRVSDEQLGRLILFNFGTQIVADVLATRFADRMGYRLTSRLAEAFCAGRADHDGHSAARDAQSICRAVRGRRSVRAGRRAD